MVPPARGGAVALGAVASPGLGTPRVAALSAPSVLFPPQRGSPLSPGLMPSPAKPPGPPSPVSRRGVAVPTVTPCEGRARGGDRRVMEPRAAWSSFVQQVPGDGEVTHAAVAHGRPVLSCCPRHLPTAN